MSDGIIWVEDDRLLNPLHGEVMAADLVGDNAEEVKRIGMIRLHGGTWR